MMNAIMSKDRDEREEGNRILKNVARLINAKKSMWNKKEGLDKNEFDEFQ
jgi:hypothetical protein